MKKIIPFTIIAICSLASIHFFNKFYLQPIKGKIETREQIIIFILSIMFFIFISLIIKNRKSIKNWFIRTLNLKGSWSWAKKQMMKGEMVKCKHWSGSLKYKIDSADNTLLQSNYNIKNKGEIQWEATFHHLSDEKLTDY